MSVTTTKLDTSDKRLIASMHVLGDSTRYKIFKILLNKDEPCVSQIASELGVSTPAVSQHFKIFEQCNLVDKTRYGQKICYRLRTDDHLVKSLIRIITNETK